MGRKYTDNALTTLATSITSGSTTLTVATGKGNNFPAITGHGTPGATPDYFVITMENAAGAREKIRIEHRGAGSDVLGSGGFNLVRGYDGTTAQAWNTGDSVDLRMDKSAAQGWEDGFNANALGRAFGYKDSTTVGLNFGYYGGIPTSGGAPVADGTVALTASQTNFVERTVAGVVSANIVGFTAGRVPLYTVVTSATAITSITEKRAGNTPVDTVTALTSVLTPLVTSPSATSLTFAVNGGATQFFIDTADGDFKPITDNTRRIGTATQRIASVFTPIIDSGTTGSGELRTNNGSTRVTWDNNGALAIGGRASPASGVGIAFPATQSASTDANTLDDYEEGTWSPVARFGGASVGITYGVQAGSYVKIGQRFDLWFELALTSKGSSVGAMDIAGVPFTMSVNSAVAIQFGSSPTAFVSMLIQPFAGGTTLGVAHLTAAAASYTGTTDAVVGNNSTFKGALSVR